MSPEEISKSLVDELTRDAHAQVDRHRERIEAAIYQATLGLRERVAALEGALRECVNVLPMHGEEIVTARRVLSGEWRDDGQGFRK